jgi:hypothetical protein
MGGARATRTAPDGNREHPRARCGKVFDVPRSPRAPRLVAPARLLALLACAAALGCNDISRFSTGAGEAYCGSIIPGPFVRQGFGPGVRMRLTFDADRIADAPGVLSTDDRLFERVGLRPIPQLHHDPLSTLQFGDGRVRNLLFGVEPKSGPTAFVFVSLIENGNVEVRVLRGAPPAAGVTAVPVESGTPLFGVFPLAKQTGSCGF